MARLFRFKKFDIRQDYAAMKVGVDGVLLGAWARVESSSHILDIGTGTGLIALMVAQRSNACIIGLEPDKDALNDAAFNFNCCPWKSRLKLVDTTFESFQTKLKFDHLISNPPFYQESIRSANQKRDRARYAGNLPLEVLLTKASKLLSDSGVFSLILPADQEFKLRATSLLNNLNIRRLCYVSSFPGKVPHRILVEIGRMEEVSKSTQLFIRSAPGADYSPEYRELTRAFYLAF